MLERSLARTDMLVHRVHSCTIHSIRERAFLILGELRHRTAAGKPTAGCRTVHCTQERHTLSTGYVGSLRVVRYHLDVICLKILKILKIVQ